MTEDKLREMREAYEQYCNAGNNGIWNEWQAAWTLATNRERERCARVCEDVEREFAASSYRAKASQLLEQCAAAIREQEGKK